MTRHPIVVEETQTGYSAYAPELPGCISTGRTREEVEKNMQKAIALHVDLMNEEGVATTSEK